MYQDLFSKRYGLRPTPEGLMNEGVPERARVGLYHLVEQFFEERDKQAHQAYLELYKGICVALRITRNRHVQYPHQASSAIERLIMNCEWWQYYDICEVMWHMLKHPWGNKDKLSAEINTLFREEQLGFEMREGKIEKVGSGFVDAKIKEARYLLKEPEFKGADYLFEKAIKALNIRPKPDVENCVKDAVAAIESVGRVITGNNKALLDKIIKDLTKKEIIPKPLNLVIEKLNAYRGDEPGVAHGAVEIPKVTVDEAEFILATSAASIIYLVKKREQIVKTI